MKAVALFLALGLVVLLGACGGAGSSDDNRAETLLPLPDVSSVSRVMPRTPDRWGTTFSEPKRIGEVLEVLEGLRPGWELVTDPSVMAPASILYSAQLNAEDEILLVLWVGEDWVGANDLRGGTSVWQRVGDSDREKLLRSLGLA